MAMRLLARRLLLSTASASRTVEPRVHASSYIVGRPTPHLVTPKRNSQSLASRVAWDQTCVNVPETQVTKLGNGVRVASEDWNTPTCTVGVYIDAGTRFENSSNNGVAHFLEHMVFKGTNKRSQRDLELEVENRGAQLNAYTSREMTVYYARCFSDDVPWAVELLSDILRNSTLEESQIEKERGVILREVQEVEQNLQEVVFDYLHATAYQGTPLGQTILGPNENIKSLTRQDIKNYINSHYVGPRMVIAGAGGVNHTQLSELTDQHFGDISATYPNEVSAPKPCRFTGSELRHRDDAYPFCHIALAVEGPGWSNPDSLAMTLASTIVGSWDRTQGGGAHVANRLARGASEGTHLESFQSFNTSYSDTGLWGVHCTAGKLETFNAISHITNEWMRVCTSLTEHELQRAKNQLKSTLAMTLDGTQPVCEDIGRHMLAYGRRIPMDELERRIDILTPKQVMQTCMHYIYDKDPAMASFGPCEALHEYNELRAQMQSSGGDCSGSCRTAGAYTSTTNTTSVSQTIKWHQFAVNLVNPPRSVVIGVLRMKDSILLWVGDEASKLGALALALPAVSDQTQQCDSPPPLSTSLYRPPGCAASSSEAEVLAGRLTSRLGRQVLCAYSLPGPDETVLQQIETAVAAEISSKPYVFGVSTGETI